MSDELVDAIVVAHKFVGPDFVIVRLEDGTELKITLNCEVLKAKDQKNPDGSPKYHTNIGFNVAVKAPVGKTVKVPKSTFGQQSPSSKPPPRGQVT
jgi:hypothetical protein